MSARHVYLNGNGVLFTNTTETGLWKTVGFGLRKHYQNEGNHTKARRLLWNAVYDLGVKAILPYKFHLLDEPQFEDRMYATFNEKVLNGEPYQVVLNLVHQYARDGARKRIDADVVERTREFVTAHDGESIVLSTGCKPKIVEALAAADLSTLFPADHVHANDFVLHGDKIERFAYDGLDVRNELERVARSRRHDIQDIAYVGHDYRDWGAMQFVHDEGGKVLVRGTDREFIDRAGEELNATSMENGLSSRRIVV